jgi:CheY-like chemotaxis protein
VPSILVVHPDRKSQRTVQRILGATGLQIDVADDVEQARRLLAHVAPLLVIIDGALATTPHGDVFLTQAQARGTRACMALVDGSAIAHIPRIIGTGAITNLLAHPMPVLAEELTITAQKLVRDDLFGAEKYMLWGTQLQTHVVARASQRSHLIDQLAQAVRSRGQSARVASIAMLVADELVSNAVHNAPVDAAGNHYRRDLPRDVELELDERQQVRLRWGCDARYLAIEVNDRFGSLDRDTILRSLSEHELRETGAGAGMGMTLSYRSCDHLVFNLSPGKRTEIIALIDVRYPPSERAPVSSYNVFVERGL